MFDGQDLEEGRGGDILTKTGERSLFSQSSMSFHVFLLRRVDWNCKLNDFHRLMRICHLIFLWDDQLEYGRYQVDCIKSVGIDWAGLFSLAVCVARPLRVCLYV